VEFKKPHSIFQQIADHVCNEILVGGFKEGEKIPSVRQMASELQVNPNTTMRAYAFLQEQDVLVNKRGVGFFVADDARVKITARNRRAFLREDLPLVFDSMIRLNIDISDIEEHFEQYKERISV
jgi:GntR family transcriptional regulator